MQKGILSVVVIVPVAGGRALNPFGLQHVTEEFSENRDEGNLFRLVVEAKQGDAGAVDALYRLYKDRLMRAARKRLGQDLRKYMETQDILQSVWKDALTDLDRFQYKNQKAFFNWLLLRIVRKIQDKWRYYNSKKRSWNPEACHQIMAGCNESQHSKSHAAADSCESAISNEKMEAIIPLMESLSPDHRKVLLLRLNEGKTYVEIAEIMNRSEPATRQLYHR
ncbi:MAG: RNA polymerase sigma factor, partial [Planctomycetota bacterium]